jgi:hypothetical protein
MDFTLQHVLANPYNLVTTPLTEPRIFFFFFLRQISFCSPAWLLHSARNNEVCHHTQLRTSFMKYLYLQKFLNFPKLSLNHCNHFEKGCCVHRGAWKILCYLP